VIAANDALCLFLMGERAQGQSHLEAGNALTRACKGTPLERQVARRLRQLTEVIQQKNPSSYSGKQIDPETASRVMKQAARFIEWMEETLPADEPE